MSRLACVLVMLLFPALVRAQSACTLRGRPYRLPIAVAELGESLLVTGHRSEVVLDAARAHAVAHVAGPIAFAGSVDPLALLAYARPGHALAEGTLRLGPGGNVHLLADGSVVALLGPGLTAALPSFPCGALTLTRPADHPSDTARLPRVTHRVEAGVVLPLYAGAESRAPAATLRTTQPVELSVAETRGDRSLVVTDLGLSRIHGWVSSALLTPIAEHEPELSMMGDMIGGACGRSDHSYAYDGAARIRTGALVRGPSGAVWGRLTRPLSVARVGVRSEDPTQVELLRVEGLESLSCGEELLFDLALVSATDVQRGAAGGNR